MNVQIGVCKLQYCDFFVYINENNYSVHNIQFNQLEYTSLCDDVLAFYLK